MDAEHATVSRFFLPEIICGRGALIEVGRTARRLGGSRVFLLSEPAVAEAGWVSELQHHLHRMRLQHVLWDEAASGPQERDVHAALDAYHAGGCDVIVAVGGRAALNLAIAVAVVSTGSGSVGDYHGFDRVTQLTPPVVAVPTTVGSGAGVLPSCTVRDARGRIVTMLGCALVPEAALVDSRTIGTLAPELVAAGGFDAITMALASYLSRTAGAMTDPHALAALHLISEHLVQSVDAPDDPNEAAALTEANVHAGIAFTTTLSSTVDALARTLADQLDIPRGTVAGILLPHAIRRSSASYSDRYSAVAEVIGLSRAYSSGQWGADIVADWARALADKVGLPAGLADLGVTVDVVDQAVRDISSAHESVPEDLASLLHTAL